MEHGGLVVTVVGVVGLLLVAAAAAIGLKRTSLPYTVGLVLVGLLLGVVAHRAEALHPLTQLTLSPEIILFIFLPTLIFESAFALDSRLLAKNLAPVLTLAAPGLLISTLIVGGIVAAFTSLPLGPALLFGALISATDPVAVVALFKEIGAPKRLAILVEGESLFNDATAIVLFNIILAVLAGGALTAATVGEGMVEFVVVFAGGLVVGGLIGYLMIRTIALADDDPLVEVALSTVVAYTAFIAADHYLEVSGVMATVGAGVVVGTLGSTRFSPHVRSYLHQFWEYAAFVANSLIFLLVGMTIDPAAVWAYRTPIGVAIGAALVARLVTVFGLTPVVGRLPGSEPIDTRYRIILFWGGLRGAVALALVLSLAPDFPQRDLLVALTVGMVLFTLLTGGPTIGPLMRKLGLNRPSLAEQVGSAQAILAAKREAISRMDGLKTSGHFSDLMIEEMEDEYRDEIDHVEAQLKELRAACTSGELGQVLWVEALAAEQTAFRVLFENGATSEPVFRELELAVELRRDRLKRGEIPSTQETATPIELRAGETLVRVVGRVFPRNRWVQRHRLRALAAKYEHDTAVLEASRRVIEEINILVSLSGIDSELAAECRGAYQRFGDEAMARIDDIAEHFPEYARAVQRQTARRIALDGEADAIAALAAKGGIPASAAREARRAVDASQRELARRPVSALEFQPAELLGRVPMFEKLTPEDFQRVVAALAARTFLAGEDIIRQGEHGTSLFLLARGVVAVFVSLDPQKDRRMASLYAGEFFGEMALLTAQPRTATVRAVTDCQLYELKKRDVDAICGTCTGVKAALVEAYEQRQRELRERRSTRPSMT
jgi:CPA1 family monovalent cation:H+ antiporter